MRKLLCLFWFVPWMGLSACASHVDCLDADIFGHCKQWKGQEKTCENPDFLGFCPRG